MRLRVAMGSLAILGVAAFVAGCSGGGGDSAANSNASSASSGESEFVKLQGAGASFPAPLYTKWFRDFSAAHGNVQIDYQSVGSGSGVKSFIDKTVDFGASDAAMKPEEIAQVSEGVVLLPLTAGSVVLAYNLEGVSDLNLSREAYVDIFLGKITRWNDPAIQATNEGLALPDMPINLVVRADSSGTTFVFTKHLSAISPEFADSPGTAKMPNWPAGTRSKGNEGVTASIMTTPGSIGYVEFGYAKGQDLPTVALENKNGKFIMPSAETAMAAMAEAEMPEDLILWIPDPAGDNSYPIITYTWLLCYKNYEDPKKAEILKEVVTYCLDKGQAESESLGYIPLPDTVVEKVKAALATIS